MAGDAASMQLLIQAGADVARAGAGALALSVMTKCQKCVELLTAKGLDKLAYTIALLQNAPSGDVRAIRMLLDKGADVNAVDPMGRIRAGTRPFPISRRSTPSRCSSTVERTSTRGADTRNRATRTRAC